jgi:Domain of unknown function DUF29
MSDLYDTDIQLRSERQASLLRRLAAGERVNDQVDWHNVVEEVETVGNEQLLAVESFLVQAPIHMLKAQAWPDLRDVPAWRAEADRFRGDAASRCAPPMRQRIDIAKLYRRALRDMPATMDDRPPLPVPQTCPLTLDELLAES